MLNGFKLLEILLYFYAYNIITFALFIGHCRYFLKPPKSNNDILIAQALTDLESSQSPSVEFSQISIEKFSFIHLFADSILQFLWLDV